MPECVASFEWGGKLTKGKGEISWKKAIKEQVNGMDDQDFDVFLAQVVIKASGKGVVGKDLSDIVEVIRGLRE